jgi:hypothetical protein
MKKFLTFLVIVFAIVLCVAQEVRAEKPLALMMKVEGTRHTENGAINLCVITLGDTAWQDAKADMRSKSMPGNIGPFALNAAQYAPNGDGTWRMWNFRSPMPEQTMQWIEYIGSTEVSEFLENFDRKTPQDFGKPGDFIHARGHIAASELPEPFNKASAATLASALSLFRYNEDGTWRMELRDPYWEEEKAQVIFNALSAEIGGK